MKELKSFSIEEMSVLEALDVKGGTAELAAVTQNGCPNNVAGCACEIVINPGPSLPTVPSIPTLG